MIATPSSKIHETPHDPFLDYTQNIFAGLNFPEVPKNDISTLVGAKKSNTTINESNNSLIREKPDDMMIELQVTHNKPPAVLQQLQQSPKQQHIDTGKIISAPSLSKLTEETPIVRPNQFTLLYKNETGTNIPLYPSLTEMTSNSLYESSPQYLEQEEDATEDAPLISPTVVPAPQSLDQNVHDEVLTQLLSENTRLQQELESLRTKASKTDEREDIEALQRSMNYTLSPHPLYNESHQQVQQQSPISQVPVRVNEQQRTNPQTPAQQQTQGTKYVCCGNCRQWLSAPRDATYVYCPGCQAVNNCALAPSPAPATAPERAPPRVLEAQPWYLQCFSRVLG